MPDTSPRGDGVPDEDPHVYNFGVGAGSEVPLCRQIFVVSGVDCIGREPKKEVQGQSQ